MTVFGDVNVSVYGNSDVLKFTFTFKCVLLENQKCNYFNHVLYIVALYLLFIPVSFIKFNPLSLSWYFFYKILEMSCFMRRRRKVANNYMSRDCTSRLYIDLLLGIYLFISNSQRIGSHTMKRVNVTCSNLK